MLLIFSELKRRNVLRIGAAYLAGSWLLIQIADTLIPFFELPGAAGRVLVIVLAIGFIPALLTAWLFELTPEGFKQESSVSHSSAESVRATRRFDRAIIAILALAVVVFAVDRFVLDPGRDARRVADAVEQARTVAPMVASCNEPSIAVLAFENLSPDGDLEYFSDGISIELMDLLMKIQNMCVIGRESAFWFKGKDATYAEIGANLGVGRLLEGTVQVSDDQVRVTASLIDPGTGVQVWSYSPGARPMADVFAIQTEIATAIVNQLRIALTGDLPALDQTTPETHSLYLRARHIVNTTTPERETVSRYTDARDLLIQAVERDPNFFPARNLLAITYFYLSSIPGLDGAENLRLWASTNRQAALIWPDRAEIKAFYAMQAFLDQDYAAAAQYLELSLRQDSSLSAPWAFAQNLLHALNRPDDSVALGEYVLSRDPLCGPCYQALARNYVSLRQFERAVDIYAQAESLGFEMPPSPEYAWALLFTGDAEAALEEWQRFDELPPVRLAGSATALYALDRKAEYQEAVAELDDLVRTRPELRVLVARVHAFVGDIARAFELLNSLPQLPARVFSDPEFDSLREHPRYDELREKAGIWPNDWRERIEFNFELPE